MRRLLLPAVVILTLCFPSRTEAQDFSWLLKGAGSVLKSTGISALYKYAHSYDTTYYAAKPGIFDVKLMENMLGSVIHTSGSEYIKKQGFKSHIKSEGVVNSSINVGLYGIGLSYTFDPFGGEKKDSRFMLSLYGNLLGIDLLYNNIKTFSGYSEYNKVRHTIPYGTPSLKLLDINAYMVFNHKHFSYPSGVCQSYIQRKSSGSVIGGVTYSRNKTSVEDLGFDVPDLKIDAKLLAIGAGYGYTFVPARNIQFSAMLMPKLVIYDSSRVNLLGKKDAWMIFKKPEFTYNLSFAAVKWMHKFYCALTALAEGYTIGSPLDDFQLFQMQWHIHAHVGINF